MGDENVFGDGVCAFCDAPSGRDIPLPPLLLDCPCGGEHQTCFECRKRWANRVALALPETDLHSCPDVDEVRVAAALMRD